MVTRLSSGLPGTAPAFSSLVEKKKKKKVDSYPDIPAGLQTQYIRKWESIPDDYIIKNFVLEEHRAEEKRTSDAVPLFKTLIEQMLNRSLSLITSQDDEDEEESPNLITGQRITMNQLKDALNNFLGSEATLALFQCARIHYHADPSMYGRGSSAESQGIYPAEIFLCKEDITYESDRAVIDKLKRAVFNKIVRYRRVKEKY